MLLAIRDLHDTSRAVAPGVWRCGLWPYDLLIWYMKDPYSTKE